MLVEVDGRADDAGVGMEGAAPQGVAEHYVGGRVGAVLVGLVEESARLGLHAEEVKIIAGDFIPGAADGGGAPVERGMGRGVDSCEAAEGGVALTKIFEGGIGRGEETSSHEWLVAKLVA